MERSAPLTFVLAGHVDHGKSSLLGRLLHELDLLPAGKAEELAAMSARRGVPLEWSFVLDGFQAERDQAITLDTTRVRLKTPHREFVVIDAPGHKELLKNMIGGRRPPRRPCWCSTSRRAARSRRCAMPIC